MVSEHGPAFENEQARVAPDRVATPRFDAACALAIGHLTRVAPLGMWAITRVVNGQQLMLAIDAPAYDIVAGAHVSLRRLAMSVHGVRLSPAVLPGRGRRGVRRRGGDRPDQGRAYLGAPIVWAAGSCSAPSAAVTPTPNPSPCVTSTGSRAGVGAAVGGAGCRHDRHRHRPGTRTRPPTCETDPLTGS